jgi:hypothetical protein
MKVHTRIATAVVLAVSLSLSSVAVAAPRERGNRGRDVSEKVVRFVKQFFGVSTHDDLPLPPPPRP